MKIESFFKFFVNLKHTVRTHASRVQQSIERRGVKTFFFWLIFGGICLLLLYLGFIQLPIYSANYYSIYAIGTILIMFALFLILVQVSTSQLNPYINNNEC